MKNLLHVSIFALTLASLNSCASISNVVDDDVYMVKATQIPTGESLDDETSYSAYKYKKDQNNNLTRYQGTGSAFRGGMMIGMGYNNGFMGYNPYMYNPYGYNPYGIYDPYGYYTPYGHHGSSWAYMPGYGWTYIGGNPYGHGYGYYGNNGFWGNNYGYGGGFYGGGYYGNPYYGYGNPYYGNPYYGYGYGNNGYGYGNNGGGGYSYSGPKHATGPRGSSSGGAVVTRRNIPGTVKMGTVPVANTNSNRTGIVNTASGEKVTPVGRDNITTMTPNRQSVSKTPSYTEPNIGTTNNSRNNATGTSTTMNRPGRIETVPNNTGSGRTNNPGSVTVPSRSSSSPSTTPTRNSGREYSTPSNPSRNSGREYSTPSTPSRSSGSGSSGSGSSGGGRSSGSGGSVGGGRR